MRLGLLVTLVAVLLPGCEASPEAEPMLPGSEGGDDGESPEMPGSDRSTSGALDTGSGETTGTGGESETGGDPTSGRPADHSAGCGGIAHEGAVIVHRSTRVGSRDRPYHIFVPAGYDPETAYPLLFVWHSASPTWDQAAAFGFQSASDGQAILVFPEAVREDGVDGRWGMTPSLGDLEYFDNMANEIYEEFCFDTDWVYTMGFSQGGIWSNTIACLRGENIRGMASSAGALDESSCFGNVAAYIIHGREDNVIPFAAGQESMEYWRDRNGCTTEPTVRGPGDCLEYTDCETYPVVWCPFDGDHLFPNSTFVPEIWRFFAEVSQL